MLGIIKKLYDVSTPSPTGKEKWNKRAIEAMLSNEKYTSTVTLLDSATQEYQYQMKECIPPIITENEFRAVQKEKAKRSNLITDDSGTHRSKKNIFQRKRINKNLHSIRWIIIVNSADLLNSKVKHKFFGIGVITEVSGNHLTIKFTSRESKFVYPDAFEKFIVADDAAVQAEIMKEINNIKLAAEAQHQAAEKTRKAEEEHRATERQTVPSKRNKINIENGFGSDYNVRHLAKQPILTYQQVEEQFGIKISGFGRGINITQSAVVLISSIEKKRTGFVYHDHWTSDGDYIYSGEGKTGDQIMTRGNKAIVDAASDGKLIYLFVKLSPQEYYYQGIFALVDYTYADEKDETGNIRKEYKFKLRKQTVEE